MNTLRLINLLSCDRSTLLPWIVHHRPSFQALKMALVHRTIVQSWKYKRSLTFVILLWFLLAKSSKKNLLPLASIILWQLQLSRKGMLWLIIWEFHLLHFRTINFVCHLNVREEVLWVKILNAVLFQDLLLLISWELCVYRFRHLWSLFLFIYSI